MVSNTWFERIRSIDVRILAAIAATLMLIIGVMWVVPTTPTSNSFTFDTERRDFSSARPVALAEPIEGAIVDGSDADYYRISPLPSAVRLDVHMTNGSTTLIPAVRIFDGAKNLVLERSKEYLRSPGANVDCSFPAQSNTTYYVQMFGQRNTNGPYTLTITPRQ
jgi:hypothetical protein